MMKYLLLVFYLYYIYKCLFIYIYIIFIIIAGIRKFEAKGVQVDGWGRDKFIACTQLKDSWIGLCVNDTVIFKVEITVYGGLSPISPSNCISGAPVSTLAQSLTQAFNNANHTFGDMTIVVQGEEIITHKCILSARSPVFQAMLRHNSMLESSTNRVQIDDIDIEVMKELINFIYTDIIR